MTTTPSERLVLSYLGEKTYHKASQEDDLRPVCEPRRIRGVPMMRVFAERDGLDPCPRCWPDEDD